MREEILSQLQQKTSLKQFLQLESPQKKVKKSWFLTGVYFGFYLLVFTVGTFFTFPNWQHWAELSCAYGTWFFATVFFVISICRNPGYI